MAGLIVIVAYRPKPGQQEALLALVRLRVPTLREEGLVTDRPAVLMRAQDGTLIEVSEWMSPEAIAAAHKNPRVLAMWDKFSALCECGPLREVPESAMMFASFEPVANSPPP